MFGRLRKISFLILLMYSVVFTLSVKTVFIYLYFQQPAQVMHVVEKSFYPLFGKFQNRISCIMTASCAVKQLPKAEEQISSDVRNSEQFLSEERVLQNEIEAQFGKWRPLNTKTVPTHIELDGVEFTNLQEAVNKIKDNSHLKIPSGVYQQPLFIKNHNVTIEGIGHVVFEKGVTQGKGFILATGNELTVKNIECRYIQAQSKNGACIRLEGHGLKLENVYFHSSETGLLETSKEHGYIQIYQSRFENLAAKARAHSIYLNNASLHLKDTLILGNRNQHSLKSRGPYTLIEQSILAELSASASRLVDIPNGGELIIDKSILQKGPNSENNQLVGFGLEGIKHSKNRVVITNSVVLFDRPTGNYLLNNADLPVEINIEKNVIISADEKYPGNINLAQRDDLSLAAYPAFPQILCHLQRCLTQIPANKKANVQ